MDEKSGKITLLERTQAIIHNTMTSRLEWLRRLLDPRRNLGAECGHPEFVSKEDCMQLYRRNDIATRVVNLYPDESWKTLPDIFEVDDSTVTAFEKAWTDLEKQFHILATLHRGDVVSGIGRFGIVLLGVGDGQDLAQPLVMTDPLNPTAAPIQQQKLIFLRALDETQVQVKLLEGDTSNPRYGQPKLYRVNFLDTTLGDISSVNDNVVMATKDVHWSRIIHLCDNRINSEIFGQPRLMNVFNRILDLQKVAGGSAEMFWKGGFPGLSVEAMPTADGEQIEFDEESVKEQMQAYMNGLQRYIATLGMTVKSLNVQIADPSHHLETQIRLISIALSCPWRLLMGAEVGQLASQQDVTSWNTRMSRRRDEYINPFVLRPFIDRLLALNILPPLLDPEAGYIIEWDDPNTPSETEKATVAEKKTKSMLNYVQGGLDALMGPEDYFMHILGLRDDLARKLAADVKSKSQFKLAQPTTGVNRPGGQGTAQTSATRPSIGNS